MYNSSMRSSALVKEEPADMYGVGTRNTSVEPTALYTDLLDTMHVCKQELTYTQTVLSSCDMPPPVRVKEEPVEAAAFEIEILPTLLHADPQYRMMPYKQQRETYDTQPTLSQLKYEEQTDCDVDVGRMKQELNVERLMQQPSNMYKMMSPKQEPDTKELEYKSIEHKYIECFDFFDEKQTEDHIDQKRLTCKECHKDFSQKSHLSTHVLIHTGERRYKCTECEKTFPRGSNLNVHMLIHFGERRFKCFECHKGFLRASHLQRHMLVHTGERHFMCTVCQKVFSRKGHLKTHMLSHTGERKFKCLECDKEFTRASHLKSHKTVHTRERCIKCLVCHKDFSRPSHLKRHMLIHSGKRFVNCLECDKGFTRSDSLRKHILSVHSH